MDLNKKLGPLKTKYWLIAAPVVLVGVLYLRSRSTAAATGATDTTDPDLSDGTSGGDAGLGPTTGAAGSGDYGGGGMSASDGTGAGEDVNPTDPGGIDAESQAWMAFIDTHFAGAGAGVSAPAAPIPGTAAPAPIKAAPAKSLGVGNAVTKQAAGKEVFGTPQPANSVQHLTAAAPNHAPPPPPLARQVAASTVAAKKATAAAKAVPKPAPAHHQ